MSKEAKPIGGGGRLRNCAVESPGVRGRSAWCCARIILADHKAAASSQQVGMLGIPHIEQMYRALRDGQFSNQSGCPAVFVRQQPGVIALASGRVGNVLQVNLQLVSDPLVGALIYLPAAQKVDVPSWCHGRRNRGTRSGRGS